MSIVNATNARNNFFKLMEDTIENNEIVTVTGKPGNVIIMSEEDYKALQETIYLHSVPGLVESIKEGMDEPMENMAEYNPDEEW